MADQISIFDLDPDFRKEPKTDHYCALCQRDLQAAKRHAQIHLAYVEGFELVANGSAVEGEDHGLKPVGPECVKKVPTKYRH